MIPIGQDMSSVMPFVSGSGLGKAPGSQKIKIQPPLITD